MRYFLAACLILLPACSKKETSISLVREIPFASESAATAAKQKAQLECVDRLHCPTQVGLLLVRKGASLLSCTSFLIAEDTLATNSHCLASIADSSACAERVEVIFPSNGSLPEARFPCQELLDASRPPNNHSPDFALVKLAPTGRKPLPLSKTGVASDKNYLSYKIFPGKSASGVLQSQKCHSAGNSYRFPLYQNEKDSVFLVGDCPSAPGNSGSPILNHEGRVAGILQAELPITERQKQAWMPYLLGEGFAPLALGTSIHCLNENCAPLRDEIEPPRIEDFSLRPAMNELLNAYKHPLFQWQTETTRSWALLREETLTPVCFAMLPKENSADIRIPKIQAKIFFNRYMQMQPKISVLEETMHQFSFNLEQLQKIGASEVKKDGESLGSLQLCAF